MELHGYVDMLYELFYFSPICVYYHPLLCTDRLRLSGPHLSALYMYVSIPMSLIMKSTENIFPS